MKAAAEKQRAAVAVQRDAVRKQAEAVGVRSLPWTPVAPLADSACEPLTGSVVAPLVEGAAKAQNVQPSLLRAVIEQESGLRACAISPKGAEGLMQLMPQTVQDLGVQNPFDPQENVEAGAKFLKQLLDKYKGDLAQALGAYNAGPAATDEAGGIPDVTETRDYVDAILKKLGK
jgi:soluble lytic murein transglycosylase-like protein